MILRSEPSQLSGNVPVPASKSHTIRALAFATLADGVSEIANPLDSADTRACRNACHALGATIEPGDVWRVTGVNGQIRRADHVIDVMNSGTTLYIVLSMAALSTEPNVFTGDAQIQKRSAEPLLQALRDLGAHAVSRPGNGCVPIEVRGPLAGGRTSLACPTSQYLTSLLITCPLAPEDTEIEVTQLNERPYVQMTLDWMARLKLAVRCDDDLRRVRIPGGQGVKPFKETVKGDFSSATFFLCAAAITGGELILDGLDMDDPQGDKAVVRMLERMGAEVKVGRDEIRVRGGGLTGVEHDLNATPDALPAMAIAGCFADGVTRLVNVPQARIKETDRIAVMHEVITALGGEAEELPDGLVVTGAGLKGGHAPGHDDHRVVMAAAVGGLAADTAVEVDTAEAVSVTFPDFVKLMNRAGAKMTTREA